MKVEQIMSRPAVTCLVSDTANRAAQLMWDADIGCVMVLYAEGKLAGVITDRDLCMAAYTRGAPLWQITVGDGCPTWPVKRWCRRWARSASRAVSPS